MTSKRIHFGCAIASAILLVAVAGLQCGGQRKENAAKTETAQSAAKDKRPAVTATKEDLARIVMIENVLVDSEDAKKEISEFGSPPETKKVVATVLTDGSGYRLVRDLVSTKPQPEYISTEQPLITPDARSLLYIVDYEEPPTDRMKENLVIEDMASGELKEVFPRDEKEYPSYAPKGPKQVDHFIADIGILAKQKEVFVYKIYSIWALDLVSGKKLKYQTTIGMNNMVPSGRDECYVNYLAGTKRDTITRVAKLNIAAGKFTPMGEPFDRFSLRDARLSEDAGTILVGHLLMQKSGDSTLYVDTTYVFDNSLHIKKLFYLSPGFTIRPDPSGKWLYYTYWGVIRRVRLSDLPDRRLITDDEVDKLAQVVYSCPKWSTVSNMWLFSEGK